MGSDRLILSTLVVLFHFGGPADVGLTTVVVSSAPATDFFAVERPPQALRALVRGTGT